MNSAGGLKLRMIADLTLVFALLGVPLLISSKFRPFLIREWGTMGMLVVPIVTFLITAWFWYDFLRTLQRLRGLNPGKTSAER